MTVGTYSVPMPLDDDGFLRRQCPHCSRQFKWHNGPTAGKPEGMVDPEAYHCPRCGNVAGHDEWWTDEQVALVEESMSGHAFREVTDTLEDKFRGIKGMTYRPSYEDEPVQPTPLHEPNDMLIVTPPCHVWEPIKVPEEATARIFCLICGEAFAA
jgi:ribosomal protein S27AE